MSCSDADEPDEQLATTPHTAWFSDVMAKTILADARDGVEPTDQNEDFRNSRFCQFAVRAHQQIACGQ